MAATALKGIFSKLRRIKKSAISSSYPVHDRPNQSPPSGASSLASSTSSTCLLQGDHNLDGKISIDELEAPMGYVTGGMTRKNKPDVRCIQFKTATQQSSTPTPEDEEDEDLKKAFAVYDQNGDGLITAEELYRVLRRVVVPLGKQGAAVTLAECRNMIRVLDRDGDGAVSFKEFAAMVGSAPVAAF